MKKRTIIIITSILIPILIIGGIIGGFKMNEQQTKDRQIAFLKAHEQEMTEYIKSKNPTVEIEKIEFDYTNLEVEDSGSFTARFISLPIKSIFPDKINNKGTIGVWVDNLDSPDTITDMACNNYGGNN
ncbi:hypothetical protein [Lactovum odontotermitis]